MYKVKIIYKEKEDRELVSLIDTKVPFFIDFINFNTISGRKEGINLMNYWSAKKLPLVILKENDKNKIFYSDIGENAVNQLIKYLNSIKENGSKN